jgi:phage recombination protein Bet
MADNAIARIPSQPLARSLEFTAEQRQMIRDTYASGATDAEFAVLMEIAKARTLNPLLRQVFFVKRWDNEKRREVWAVQVSIDGLRAIAERTARYEGQTPAQWCGPDGKWVDVWLKAEPPAAARVGVYRTGFRDAVYGIARWDSYAAKKKDGGVTHMWLKFPDLMLAKCAEALAMRRAFPEDTAGLYTDDEMGQAERPAAEPKLPPKASLDAKLAAAVEVLDGEVVEETLAEAREVAADEYRMPFASKRGRWEKGAPISSLEDEDLRSLLEWKAAKDDLKSACMAELAARDAP